MSEDNKDFEANSIDEILKEFQERMQQSQMIKSYICGDQISMESLEMARNRTPGRMIQRIFIWLKPIQYRLQIR